MCTLSLSIASVHRCNPLGSHSISGSLDCCFTLYFSLIFYHWFRCISLTLSSQSIKKIEQILCGAPECASAHKISWRRFESCCWQTINLHHMCYTSVCFFPFCFFFIFFKPSKWRSFYISRILPEIIRYLPRWQRFPCTLLLFFVIRQQNIINAHSGFPVNNMCIILRFSGLNNHNIIYMYICKYHM